MRCQTCGEYCKTWWEAKIHTNETQHTEFKHYYKKKESTELFGDWL